MVKLYPGAVVDLTMSKSGANARGPWLLTVFKPNDGKPNDTIKIFVHGENALAASKWKTGKIKTISSVQKQARLYNGTWYTEVSVDVEMTEGPATVPYAAKDSFLVAPPDSLDDLPFN